MEIFSSSFHFFRCCFSSWDNSLFVSRITSTEVNIFFSSSLGITSESLRGIYSFYRVEINNRELLDLREMINETDGKWIENACKNYLLKEKYIIYIGPGIL